LSKPTRCLALSAPQQGGQRDDEPDEGDQPNGEDEPPELGRRRVGRPVVGEDLDCGGVEGGLLARAHDYRDKDEDYGGHPGDAGDPAKAPPSDSCGSRTGIVMDGPFCALRRAWQFGDARARVSQVGASRTWSFWSGSGLSTRGWRTTVAAVVEHGSMRQAAAMLNLHHSTHRERLTWLEGQLEFPLFSAQMVSGWVQRCRCGASSGLPITNGDRVRP
jgi:Bacterial regulatory helix-turn-helix protein, lysR family